MADVNPLDRSERNGESEYEVPGDTNAPDIVGRTGEEMPEVAHDQGRGREIRQSGARPTAAAQQPPPPR